MDRRTFTAGTLAALVVPQRRARAAAGADVIALGGAVTEIVYALGLGHRLVARDSTSTFPPVVSALPDVGYLRNLSAEGVLSYAPSLIVAAQGAGPPEVVDILRNASVDFVEVPDGFDADAIQEKIRIVGAALGVSDRAATLMAQTRAALAEATEQATQSVHTRKRVMFILSTQGGRIMASGTQSGADGIIRLAGAINAVTGFEGYKPLTDEAAGAAAPDVILMMDRGGDHASSTQELFALPALAATPAAQTQSVVRMDGLFMLGFGPRTADAVRSLHDALYKAG